MFLSRLVCPGRQHPPGARPHHRQWIPESAIKRIRTIPPLPGLHRRRFASLRRPSATGELPSPQHPFHLPLPYRQQLCVGRSLHIGLRNYGTTCPGALYQPFACTPEPDEGGTEGGSIPAICESAHRIGGAAPGHGDSPDRRRHRLRIRAIHPGPAQDAQSVRGPGRRSAPGRTSHLPGTGQRAPYLLYQFPEQSHGQHGAL